LLVSGYAHVFALISVAIEWNAYMRTLLYMAQLVASHFMDFQVVGPFCDFEARAVAHWLRDIVMTL